jgi:threonine dehydrogenase-like Zn-dependent dehydrogenase
MKALVLEKAKNLSLRVIDIAEETGPDDVRIRIECVGICGSDIHYYTQGRIGSYVVEEPMVLGHEASGTVIEVGANVRSLAVGDRVCMEPGIPERGSRASMLGMYNLDRRSGSGRRLPSTAVCGKRSFTRRISSTGFRRTSALPRVLWRSRSPWDSRR